jgi:hypothetical protein
LRIWRKQSEVSAQGVKYRHLVDTAPPLPEPIVAAAIQTRVTARIWPNQMVDRKRRRKEFRR